MDNVGVELALKRWVSLANQPSDEYGCTYDGWARLAQQEARMTSLQTERIVIRFPGEAPAWPRSQRHSRAVEVAVGPTQASLSVRQAGVGYRFGSPTFPLDAQQQYRQQAKRHTHLPSAASHTNFSS